MTPSEKLEIEIDKCLEMHYKKLTNWELNFFNEIKKIIQNGRTTPSMKQKSCAAMIIKKVSSAP